MYHTSNTDPSSPPHPRTRSYVFRGLSVRGFNARAWSAAEPQRARRALAAVGRLVAAGLFSLEFTEYEFESEWADAAEHLSLIHISEPTRQP